MNNYVAALWETVSGLGDRDTTCAIAGSIVAAFMDRKGIPASWLVSRERLPEWTI
ncbi:MAG: ADP-ribosylglycohydrolase family protein [Chloroflexota bacterium]